MKVYKKQIEWGGRQLTLETGLLAKQADGSVLVTYGETSVLCTVVAKKQASPDLDFFPLSVNYQEKFYASGRIPGGFLKREGRPSERETLISRLIDRPIRPLFPDLFRNETQVVCTTVSYDMENDPDIAALIGASAALTLSGIPFMGPVGGARVGYIDGKLALNPTRTDMEESSLELIVAGTREGVLMVESEAKELSEKDMLEAVMFGHKSFQPVIQAIIELAEETAKEPWDLIELTEAQKAVQKKVSELSEKDLREAYKITAKQDRYAHIDAVKKSVKEAFADQTDVSPVFVAGCLKEVESQIVRGNILKTKKRIDGRDTTTVRPIQCDTSFLSRTHGSAVFTRGETQALVVTTLGTGDSEQLIDSLDGESKETFMLHYNFPPFSVGEVGRMGSPGRREVGHGKLAWRAVHPLLPSKDQFPYTIRVVSEILESNGSSSMATVCGASLSLMDAGVPLKDHIAGIAMGLIKEKNDFAVLTDILGDEDALGDMDFKVAGTRHGITALQMDIKITSINEQIMKIALDQACEGRLHIIGEMEKAISGSRNDVSQNAPRIEVIKIPKEKIREVIGTGGKVIRDICETTGAKIDIEDDGTLRVAAVDHKAIEAALKRIYDITAEAELNGVYTGTVVKIMEFGAFVDFLNTSGLIHISEIAHHRVNKVEDELNVGDKVEVKVIGIDDKGKVRLSRKALLPDEGSTKGKE
ncbi:MAG: polyribonucleotide nucleotidyltransferase [Alphaproteobacteria bacterium]